MSLQSNIYATVGTIIAMGIFLFFKDEENVSTLVSKSMELVSTHGPKEFLFPYQVSILLDGEHYCGGAIVDETTVITSASCVMATIPFYYYQAYRLVGYNFMKPQMIDVSRLRVEAGSIYRGEGSVHSVSQAELHEDYSVVTYDWDVALMKVEEPFSFGVFLRPIALAEAGEVIEEGTEATVSGWGMVPSEDGNLNASEVLQWATIPVWSDAFCLESLEEKPTERMLCAGNLDVGEDSCVGDPGGPLVANGKLIGLALWDDKCGSPNYLGVYTKVSAVREWIDEMLLVN